MDKRNCKSCTHLGRWYKDGHLYQDENAFKLKCALDWDLNEDAEGFPYEKNMHCFAEPEKEDVQ